MEAVIKQAHAAQLAGSFSNEKDALAWVRGQVFKPILNGRLIIDGGILPSGRKVGKLLEAAKLAQRQGIFSDLDGALTWAKQWVEN
jgi:hypothetical protein